MKDRLPFLLFLFVLAFTMSSFAQTGSDEQPPLDVFAGYSHTSNFDTGLNGWILSGNYNLGGSWLGIEGDVSGHYGSQGLGGLPIIVPGLPSSVNSSLYNYDFGPRITWRAPDQPFNVFGHLLFGGSRASVTASGIPSTRDTSFSWVLGGGADYNFNATWAARAQMDLLHTDFFSNGESHPRFSVGVVFRLGAPQ